jgi:hypothetical protein
MNSDQAKLDKINSQLQANEVNFIKAISAISVFTSKLTNAI